MDDSENKRPKRPTRPGEVVDLGRELNGYADTEGKPRPQRDERLGGWG